MDQSLAVDRSSSLSHFGASRASDSKSIRGASAGAQPLSN